VRLHSDLLALAFKADITRVATLLGAGHESNVERSAVQSASSDVESSAAVPAFG
jgi:hypothetical protein